MDLISIIVPIYNAEKYLAKCIESVISQTYCLWELLLIDDGSTDSSYEICKNYSKKDSRIKYIHTENLGRVHARKTGMQNASGSVIAFLDSDDWMDKMALEEMYAQMQETSADCVIAGYVETSSQGEKVILNNMPKGLYKDQKLQQDFIPAMLCFTDFFELGIQPFLWNKLYKREIIEQFIIELDERIVVGEDVVCVFPALLRAVTISVMDKAYYHYCIHNDSTMRTYRTEEEEIENVRLQYGALKTVFLSGNYGEYLMPQLKKYILHHIMVRALSYFAHNHSNYRHLVFGCIPIGSQIIIYGAGAFGNAVFHYLRESGENRISAWCDRDYLKYQAMNYPVIAVEEALKQKYDYIYVAVMSRTSVDRIKDFLINSNVEPGKIVWLEVDALEQLESDRLL